MKLLLAAVVVAATACGSVKEAKVGEARLAYADGVDDAPKGWSTVEVMPGKAGALPDDAKQVLIAADRDATFGDVWPLIQAARTRDADLLFYVADRRQRVKVMEMNPPSDEKQIRVIVTDDGKVCVNLPGIKEAKCVMTAQHRVDRSYTRELVREAFRASDLRHVRVEAETGLRWNDVVRAVDGARTCCPGERMIVGLEKY